MCLKNVFLQGALPSASKDFFCRVRSLVHLKTICVEGANQSASKYCFMADYGPECV